MLRPSFAATRPTGCPACAASARRRRRCSFGKYGSLDGVLAAWDLSPSIRAKLGAGKDYIVAARTVVAPVLDCATGDVDGAIPHGKPSPRVIELAERYGIVGAAGRIIESLERLAP